MGRAEVVGLRAALRVELGLAAALALPLPGLAEALGLPEPVGSGGRVRVLEGVLLLLGEGAACVPETEELRLWVLLPGALPLGG